MLCQKCSEIIFEWQGVLTRVKKVQEWGNIP
jgi:hypothetical protein